MTESNLVGSIFRIFLMAVLALVISGGSYLAGFATSWYLNHSGGPVQVSPTATVEEERQSSENYTEFKVFEEAMRILRREFYGDVPDPQQTNYIAIRGVIESLDDPNTSFTDPQSAEIEQTELEGSFEGIGAEVTMNEQGQLVIVRPLPNQPAERAGLLSGDIVTHVNGEPIEGMDLTDAVLLIRGPKGSTVELTIMRQGRSEPFTVEIVRAQIETPTVTWRMVEGEQLGYIRIGLFGEPTNQELSKGIRELKDQGAQGLVLDLRNNPGGFLETAIQVSSQFLEEGTITSQRGNRGQERIFRVRPGGLARDIPLVVLVNGGSASASEIVAGAIKAHDRGTLIGQRTFGKGWVQNVHQLSDGSTLHVTIAQWLTPDGDQISEDGIAPDIKVEITEEDIQEGRDPQLQRAIEYLQSGS